MRGVQLGRVFEPLAGNAVRMVQVPVRYPAATAIVRHPVILAFA